MGVTSLQGSHARVLAVSITLLSRVYFFFVCKDLPFFSIYDINGGSSKISLSNGCFLIKCHLFMIICFKLGTDWLVLRYKGQDSFISSAVLEG